MLHRAASNAYSWWWASHIRTKQSKWLDNNLQDVEVRVENILRIIEEDGDSFARRAEMFFRNRPEVIKYVEESYRAYRALAERYDHVSGELHKANKTLATVFPDQVHLSNSDGEETSADKTLVAVFPEGDRKDEEDETQSSSRLPPPISDSNRPFENLPRSLEGLSRESAQKEIDKLLKEILIFQTEREFIKSCYERNLAKYWEIERKMTEMQKEVCLLQDQYSVSMAIENEEARALMAATALKTCEASLVHLQEQQKQSMEEACLASERIRVSRCKLNSLKMTAIGQDNLSPEFEESSSAETNILGALDMAQETLELQTMCEKIKEHFKKASVEELAAKIDDLADKIIGLEVKASSQTTQITRLRNEVDEHEKNLRSLEEEKTEQVQLRDVEEELLQLQFLEKSVKDEGMKLLSDFSVTFRSFIDLSERLHIGDVSCSSQQHCPREKEEEEEEEEEDAEDVNETRRSILYPDYTNSSQNFQPGECSSSGKDQDEKDEKEEGDEEKEHGVPETLRLSSRAEDFCGTQIFSSDHEEERHYQKLKAVKEEEEEDEEGVKEVKEEDEEEERSLDWQQMLMNGLEDREKLLLNEYTSILRNYKETKRKLLEMEKRHQHRLAEATTSIRDLKQASAAKDEEILSLRSKFQSLGSMNSAKRGERESSPSPATVPPSGREAEIPEEGRLDLQIPEEPATSNAVEERFRRDIDGLLEENLEFWLRVTASFEQIQKIQAAWTRLQAEIAQPESSSTSLFSNLSALQAELLSWLDEDAQLKSELQCRFSSLGMIKEEMSRVLAESVGEEETQLTPYRAAKFHGELLGMQQENNKVAEDLRAARGSAKSVEAEVERAMARLRRSLGVVSPANTQPHYHFRHFSGKSKIPLKSIFLFGAKPKPKKPSLFSCMNPALQKQYSDLSPGLRP